MALTDVSFSTKMDAITAVVSGTQEEMTFLAMTSNIPIYDGSSPVELENFLVAIRSALPLQNNRDKLCIRAASMRSSKLVRQVIEGFIMSTTQDQTWEALETELRKYFGFTDEPAVLRAKIYAVKQTKDETIHHFFKRLQVEGKKAFPPPLQLTDTLIQESLVKIFIKNLRDKHIRRRLISLNPTTLDDALTKATKEEATQQRFTSYGESTSQEEPMDCSLVKTEVTPQASSKYYSNEFVPQGDCYNEFVPQSTCYNEFVPQGDCYNMYVPQDDSLVALPQVQQEYYVPMQPHDEAGMDEAGCFDNPDGTEPDGHQNAHDGSDQLVYAVSVRRCWTCSSPFHIQKECPQRVRQPPPYNTYQGWQVSLPTVPRKQFMTPRFVRPQVPAYRGPRPTPDPRFSGLPAMRHGGPIGQHRPPYNQNVRPPRPMGGQIHQSPRPSFGGQLGAAMRLPKN